VRVRDEAGYGASVQTLLTQVWPVAHGVHAEVQFALVSATHVVPHMWKPALQV
jgi:hypothetical protein